MDNRYSGESSSGPRSKRPRIEAPPNHILLLTVINPLYPITTDVIHRITHTYGNVQRIVMIRKNGVQAMVEMAATEEATRCKIALQGAEIYSGCCVLRIEYAKTDKLKVTRNNENTFDYTENLPSGDRVDVSAPPRPALLPNPSCPPLAVAPTGGRFLPPPNDVGGFRGAQDGFRREDPGFRGVTAEFRGPEPGFRGPEPGFRGPEPGFRGPEPGFRDGGFRGVAESPYRSEPNGFGRERESDRDRFREPERFREPDRFREPGRMGSGFRGDAHPPPSSGGFRGRSENGFGGFTGGRRPMEMGSRGGLLDLMSLQAPSAGMYGDRQNGMSPTVASEQPGCVLMVYNLDPKRMNCDKLFNILCLYGNVIRIKFLHTKEGSAMVQMGDAMAVENVLSNLSNTVVYDKPLQFQLSKQEFVRTRDVMKPYELPDGTESSKCFADSKDNRFLNPSAKNRPQAPCKTLHFFNTPPNLTEDMIVEAIHASGVDAEPTAVLIFPPKEGDKKGKTSGGLVEFEELSDAVDVLVTANHTKMSTKTSKFPYVMRLCFSASHTTRNRGGIVNREEREDNSAQD